MRLTGIVAVLATSALALAAAGCGVSSTSSSSHCVGNRCEFRFNGAQELDVDFLRPAATLDVKDFDGDQLKVATRVSEATVRVGRRVTVGGFVVSLKELDGDTGTLLVRNAG